MAGVDADPLVPSVGDEIADTVDHDTASSHREEIVENAENEQAKKNQIKENGGGDIPKQDADDKGQRANDDEEEDEWMDILGNDLLKKRILKPGKDLNTRPARGCLVYLNTKGTLDDGKEVECNQEICFHIGEGDVIQAWDMVVCLMEVGEVAELVTDARYAFEDHGREPDIPPGARITFELELLRVEGPLDIPKLTMEERFSWGDRKRERGNELYSRKDYSGAITSYTRALKILNIEEGGYKEEEYSELCTAGIKCYNNLAAAQLKVKAYEAALKSCNSVLNIEPNNVKALFRKGKVFSCQGEYSKSIKFMKDASKLEPSNKTIQQELSKTVKQYRAELQSEKDLYKRMVGDMGNNSSNNSKKKSRNYFKWGFLSASLVAIGGMALAFILNTR